MHKDLSTFLNPQTEHIDVLASRFKDANPFRYIVVDNFLKEDLAEALLEDFPTFKDKNAISEMGTVGRKATREDFDQISPLYAEVGQVFASVEFCHFISEVSGITNLLFDPTYFGGGTHESRDGQELDVHIDFNYDPQRKLYRRLNLLIYLNKGWEKAWGGNIEIHSDPRDPDANQVLAFEPLFNRCVMFETHEHSWHGFDKIRLPDDKRDYSRKSISIYYYSKDRATEKEVPPHTTFYIQRPLPQHIGAGHTLTQNDYGEIRGLLGKRDHWIHHYQKKELEYNAERLQWIRSQATLESYIRLPVHGYISQTTHPIGYWPDHWAGRHLAFQIRADKDVTELGILCHLPSFFFSVTVSIAVDGIILAKNVLEPDSQTLVSGRVNIPQGNYAEVVVSTNKGFIPLKNGHGLDDRELGFVFSKVVAQH